MILVLLCCIVALGVFKLNTCQSNYCSATNIYLFLTCFCCNVVFLNLDILLSATISFALTARLFSHLVAFSFYSFPLQHLFLHQQIVNVVFITDVLQKKKAFAASVCIYWPTNRLTSQLTLSASVCLYVYWLDERCEEIKVKRRKKKRKIKIFSEIYSRLQRSRSLWLAYCLA